MKKIHDCMAVTTMLKKYKLPETETVHFIYNLLFQGTHVFTSYGIYITISKNEISFLPYPRLIFATLQDAKGKIYLSEHKGGFLGKFQESTIPFMKEEEQTFVLNLLKDLKNA